MQGFRKLILGVFTICTLIAMVPAAASADRGFTTRFSTNDTGDIAGIANTLMTCPAGSTSSAAPATSCAATQSVTATTASNPSYNNNYDMTYVDVDSDGSTFNSSTANQTLPSGAEILFAGLYWGGDYSTGTAAAPDAGARNTIKFKLPGSSSYLNLTADTLDDSTLNIGRYQAFRDVTSLIKALPNAGNGTYTAANVQAGRGGDHYAGWTLIVAYRDTTQPARNLTVFDGLKTIRTTDPPTAIPVSGFLTPPSGAVKTEIGFVTWEGDHGIVGDSASLNGTVLSDAQHPANNFFDSRISRDGVMYTDRNPSYANALGFESAFTNADGILGNSATSATITVTTSGDQYLPGVITFATEIYAPKIVQTKTVADDNGGDLLPGDTLTYTISGVNNGLDGTSNFVLRDPIPANTTYVPGSIKLVQNDGSTTGAVTDASADDLGEYDSVNSRIVARLGAGATASSGGNVAPSTGYKVTFRVKVGNVATGTAINNTATASFLSKTTGTPLTAVSDAPTKTVKAPDLRIRKTLTGAAPVAGSTSQYTLAIDNVGAGATVGTVTVSDPLPSGVTATSVSATGWSCNAMPATSVTCTRSDALAAGAAYPNIVINVTFGSDVSGDILNTATVSGGGDGNPANNTSTNTSPAARSADLQITKAASKPTIATGDTFNYVLTVRNNGPSDATGVTVSDTLPTGVSYVSDDSSDCSFAAGKVSCTYATLAAGATRTVTVSVIADGVLGGATIHNTATVTGNEADPTPGNNTSSADVSVAGADLAVTKKLLTATPTTGDTVTYELTVSNNGPSKATSVVLHDALPSGLTGVSADKPACVVTSTAVDCPVGTLAVGASYTVQVSGTVKNGATTITNRASAQGAESDPDSSNNADEVTTPVALVADLKLIKTASVAATSPGDTFLFQFRVDNLGPDGADTGPIIHDTLPAGVTYVDGPPQCSAVGQEVTCTLHPIAAGGFITTSFLVKVGADTHGAITNTANVTSAFNKPDPDPSNNTSSVIVPVNDVADVSISKTVDNDNPHTGDVVTYTLKAANAGPATANNVVVTDALPAGVTFVSADAPCTEAGGTVTCNLGSIAGGSSKTVQVKVKVDTIAVSNPTGTHDIDVQKVEAQIDLDPGQTRTLSVDCPTGYIVTDGSVRTDAVDQGTGTLASTQVNRSSASSLGTWTGTIRNDASGRAQAKIFAVCVKAQTSDADGHHHDLIVSDPVTVTQTLMAGRNTVTLPCGPGTLAIAPGFNSSGDLDILTSKESGDGWTWDVDVPEGTTATFSIRCLSKKVSAENGHTHELKLERLQQHVVVPAGQVVEVQLTCNDNAKGIVGGFDLDPGLISLGNDPRPKTRAFKLMNRTDHDLNADLSLLCLDGRTGGEAGVSYIVNTANVSTTTQEANTANNSDWAGLQATGADATAPAPAPAGGSTGGGTGQASSSTPAPSAPNVTPTNTVQSQIGTARSVPRALSAVVVKGSTATVTITSKVAAAGTARLVAMKTIKVGGKVIKKGTVLASGTFAVKAGKSAKVRLKATKLGLKALKSKALKSATLKLGSAASSVTVK